MDRDILIELGILGVISYILFFVSTNVNPTLGGIYQGLALLGIVLAIADIGFGRKSFGLINPKINWFMAFLISFVAYAVLVLCAYFVSPILAEVIQLKEILSLLGASAPVFSASASLNFIIFAFIIPYIETYAIFCISIDLFSSVFKIDLDNGDLFKPAMIFLIVVITIAFLMFHVNAKGIENESALILVGIMGFISCILVVLYREFRIPILFHVISNTVGLMSAMGKI